MTSEETAESERTRAVSALALRDGAVRPSVAAVTLALQRVESSAVGATSTSPHAYLGERTGLRATPPSLFAMTLQTIAIHVPTAAHAENPFRRGVDACPGDWVLEVLVAHLWEQGVRQQQTGQWCGAHICASYILRRHFLSLVDRGI